MQTRWCALLLAALITSCDVNAADRSAEPIVSRIKRQPVESTAVATVGYSRKLHALEIEFVNGAIYRYEEVPIVVYRDLLAAESKARYYDQNVRGQYHCLRVKPSGQR